MKEAKVTLADLELFFMKKSETHNKEYLATLKNACLRVLSKLPNLQSIDISQVDIDAVCRQYKTLSAGKLSDGTIMDYLTRFRCGMKMFRDSNKGGANFGKKLEAQLQAKPSYPETRKKWLRITQQKAVFNPPANTLKTACDFHKDSESHTNLSFLDAVKKMDSINQILESLSQKERTSLLQTLLLQQTK